MIFQKIKKLYLEQQSEIEQNSLLKIYSYFLIIIHFWTALFWQRQGLEKIITFAAESYCWPLLPQCELAKSWLAPIAEVILPVYFILILLGLFAKGSRQRWWFLFILEGLKISIQFLDYRFMGNYHFMPHILTLTFLFVPYKSFWIRIWLVSFYVGAATLKLNFEWLSGGSLSWRVPFGNIFLLQISALFVLLMEALVPWFLFSKSRKVKTGALAILTLFHFISYYWVGFFYPAVMLCLLAFWFLEIRNPQEPVFYSRKNVRFLVGFIPWLYFLLSQILAFGSSKEYSLGGSERLFSLNMFDARSECRGTFIVRRGEKIAEVSFKNEHFAVRVKCDPILFLEQGRQLCESQDSNQGKIEAYLVSRRYTDFTTLSIIRESDLCKRWQ